MIIKASRIHIYQAVKVFILLKEKRQTERAFSLDCSEQLDMMNRVKVPASL